MWLARPRFLTVPLYCSMLLLLLLLPPPPAHAEVATYYGYESGTITASGEPFDPEGFTAAHPFLPLGSVLTVCYDGCVTVVINDRGPVLDLAQGAARQIGMLECGSCDVAVY